MIYAEDSFFWASRLLRALAVAICRCSQKLNLQSNCTTRYLIFYFHTTSCFPKTIFGYWKDLSGPWPAKPRSFQGPFSAPGFLRRTWHSTRVVLPTSPENHHLSSLLWETICRLRISPTYCSDSCLSSATGSLEPSSASSPWCNCSISQYCTHCVCQC